MEVQRNWKIDGKKPLNPAVLAASSIAAHWPMEWYGKVNSVACPRGRRWGEAHFVVSQSTLDELSIDAAIDITCEHELGTTTWAGYYVIRSETITGDPDNSAHWITLADRRWLLERSAANVRYNLRQNKTDYVTITTNSGTPYTWQEVLDDLWALLPGVAGAAPSLPITPGSTPENLVFDGMTAWRAINQVLTAIGCGAVLDPHAGTFNYVELKATQADLATQKTDNRDRLLWAFAPSELPESQYVDKVAVTFHKIPGIDDDSLPFASKPDVEEVSLGVGGTAGTKWPIVDTMFGFDDNSAVRTARAGEIKDALIGLLRPGAESWGSRFSGVLEIPCGSEITDVLWISDGARGMVTEAKYIAGKIDWPRLLINSSGGGGGKIEFRVLSASTVVGGQYDGMRKLVVEVKSPPCNRTSLHGDTVDVYEHEPLCLTGDESDAALVDRKGWAYEGVYQDQSSGAIAGDLTDCHWVLDGLCCP